MNLSLVGCSIHQTPTELRERLAFDDAKLTRAVGELIARYGCEAVILSTCNRVELVIGRPAESESVGIDLIAEFLSDCHRVPVKELRPHLYARSDGDAVRHLFRVAASLDSLVVGEGQIVGQVKKAFELAQKLGATGAFLNALFPAAIRAAKRVRHETGISRGHVSVSSVAVDYVRQVFARFDDKTVLVIGAGKMGRLTLRHLRELHPHRILVTNRSPEKAAQLAEWCAGQAVPWAQLDEALAKADIILSTTGAAEPVVTRDRWKRATAKRTGGTQVILDIAVPRDFDPAIHDGDRTCLFNIDDLYRIREQTLEERRKAVAPAERVVEEETQKFLKEWSRRRRGALIGRLTQDCDAKRQAVVEPLLRRLNGKLSDEDKKDIELAFRRLQTQILHGPISALEESAGEGGGPHLWDAIRKLFRLRD
jgi:glutamyl-tRNA reductase